jgi:hypothetical protein
VTRLTVLAGCPLRSEENRRHPAARGGLLLPSRRRSAGRVPIRSYAILYTVRPPLTTKARSTRHPSERRPRPKRPGGICRSRSEGCPNPSRKIRYTLFGPEAPPDRQADGRLVVPAAQGAGRRIARPREPDGGAKPTRHPGRAFRPMPPGQERPSRSPHLRPPAARTGRRSQAPPWWGFRDSEPASGGCPGAQPVRPADLVSASYAPGASSGSLRLLSHGAVRPAPVPARPCPGRSGTRVG